MAQADRRQYARLTVWREDLAQAHFFARFLLKKGWHFNPWDKRIRWSTYMQQSAYTCALVTTYCRPFVETRSRHALPLKMAKYNERERKLHEKLKTLRNGVYAHSDVELHDVRPFQIDGQASAVVMHPVLKLERQETEEVLSMIRRTSSAIDEKLQSLFVLTEE